MNRNMRLLLLDNQNQVVVKTISAEVVDFPMRDVPAGVDLLQSARNFAKEIGFELFSVSAPFGTLDGNSWTTIVTATWSGAITNAEYRWAPPIALLSGERAEFNHRILRNLWEIF